MTAAAPATAAAAKAPAAASASTVATPTGALATSTAPVAQLKSAPEKTLKLSTEAYDVELTSWGARFNHLVLRGLEQDGKPLDLVGTVDAPRFGSLELGGLEPRLDPAEPAARGRGGRQARTLPVAPGRQHA
jgi:hypothetical protein